MTDTHIEDAVLAVWSDELGVQVGPDDHFFRSGGNSLRAARATVTLGLTLSCDIELATLLHNPIARHYAVAVQALTRATVQPAVLLPIIARDGSLPLSYQQESRLERERDARADGRQAGPYFIPLVVSFDVHVDTSSAESAINLLLARHESLRTGFEIGASRAEHRAFAVPDASMTLQARELNPLDANAWYAFVARTYADLVGGELDFARVPLLRARLLHFGAGSSTLIMAVEHIVFDGWSKGILFDELMALLRGDQLPALDAQYADWAAWHRTRLQDRCLEEILDYWRSRLAGASPFPPLALPAPAEPEDGLCAEISHTLPALDVAQLEQRAKVLNTTLFVLLLTGLVRAWQRKTGSTDVVIHGPTANRTVPQSGSMVGNFAHSLVYRVTAPLDEDPAMAIQATRTAVTEALLHQDIPLSLLTRYVQPEAHGRATHLPRLYLGGGTLTRLAGAVRDGTGWAVELRDMARSAEPGVTGFYTEHDTGELLLQLVFRPADVDREFVADLLLAFITELTEIAGV